MLWWIGTYLAIPHKAELSSVMGCSCKRHRQLHSASWLREMGSPPFRRDAWSKGNLLKTSWDCVLFPVETVITTYLLLWILVFFYGSGGNRQWELHFIFFLWWWREDCNLLPINAVAQLFLLLLLSDWPKLMIFSFGLSQLYTWLKSLLTCLGLTWLPLYSCSTKNIAFGWQSHLLCGGFWWHLLASVISWDQSILWAGRCDQGSVAWSF